jgi:hypothetical protein
VKAAKKPLAGNKSSSGFEKPLPGPLGGRFMLA